MIKSIVVAAAAALSAPAATQPSTTFPVQALCRGETFIGVQAVVPEAGQIHIVWGEHNPCKE